MPPTRDERDYAAGLRKKIEPIIDELTDMQAGSALSGEMTIDQRQRFLEMLAKWRAVEPKDKSGAFTGATVTVNFGLNGSISANVSPPKVEADEVVDVDVLELKASPCMLSAAKVNDDVLDPGNDLGSVLGD